MGGVVSTGQDNDDLINNLLHADYIKTTMIERVFRAVDRADYFLEEARIDAYKDSAWKNGNLHLSAPCIYSEVMEGLSLSRGLSFLNLGSGTGYLSTMVGLILGPYGTNHGIEIHEDVVLYANKKLEEFKRLSAALDEYEFCPPKFVQGNCLCLNSEFPQYDRVYCGASCPEFHENYMKNLIKVGGILIMPLNDKLLQIKRTSETTWEETFLLSVSFASLIAPASNQHETIKMLDFEPLSLQAICRSAIRTILRQNIDNEHPEVKISMQNIPKRPRKKRALRRLVVPIFEELDLETSDNLTDEEERRDLGRLHLSPDRGNTHGGREFNTILDLVLGLGHCRNDQSENELAERSEDETENENINETSTSQNQSDTESDQVLNEDDVATVSSLAEQNKWDNFDSGLDEFLQHDYYKSFCSMKSHEHSSDSEAACGMEVDSDNEENTSTCDKSNKRSPLVSSFLRTGGKLKRITLSAHRLRSYVDSDSDSDMVVEESNTSPVIRSVFTSPYTEHIRAKIQALPLPPILKQYLNLYRDI